MGGTAMASLTLDLIAAWARRTEREIRAEPFQRDVDFLRTDPAAHGASGAATSTPRSRPRARPQRGPVLLVGNHSGGSLTPDTTAFFAAWYRHAASSARWSASPSTPPSAFPGSATLMRKIGEVPAKPRNAARALDAGLPVLVYPGGDHEVLPALDATATASTSAAARASSSWRCASACRSCPW